MTDHTDTITVYHGTSEGYLDTLIRNGFRRPAVSANDMTRQIIADLLPPGTEIGDPLLDKVAKLGRMHYRALESNSGCSLFATGSARTARAYCGFAQDGGEIYAETARALRQLGYDVATRFPNARPVLLALEVPVADLSDDYRALLQRDGSGRFVAPESYEVFIQDTRRVQIKSVSMGMLPPMHPQDAQKHIAKHLRGDAAHTALNPEKQAILDDVYGFRHNDHCTTAMVKMGSYDIPVAETVIEDADGRPAVLHIPDPRFKPACETLKDSGLAIAPGYAMPHGLSAAEIKASLDIVQLRHARGEISGDAQHRRLEKLWAAFKDSNPSLNAVDIDTRHASSLQRALLLAVHGAAPEDITHTVTKLPDAHYATQKSRCLDAYGLGQMVPWDPAPATLKTLSGIMGNKLAQYEATARPPAPPVISRHI